MENEEKVIYSKEELQEKVRVPAVVEQDLKHIISERLEQCGLYFRIFSRTKTAASMKKKFERKDYGEGRKLQDLIGVRINLYFDDDVNICRHLMEETFNLIEWSTSQRSEEEFKPTKLNGVFRLPEYLQAQISPETWDMSIDTTFEIQIKTMFFEGWHEIEHDMRYKGEELWDHFPGFSRYFNSILATLELCDKSMVTLFEDMGHALYKSGQWTDMMRCHFRLKMQDVDLYPEVEELLSQDAEESVNSLGKQIYRTGKEELVEMLTSRGARKVPINVNTIAALINEKKIHDQRLTDIFREKDVYNDGRDEAVFEGRRYELRPLSGHPVFQMVTVVDGSRMKSETAVTDREIFDSCANAIYSWIGGRYGHLFNNMPAQVQNWKGDVIAYRIIVRYDHANMKMKMHVRHLDMEVGGRVWFAEAMLERCEDGRILLRVLNSYAEPERERSASDNGGMSFSYPGFYKTIVDTIGVYSGIGCYNRRRILQEDEADTLVEALKNPLRCFPVVFIMSKENEEGMMDEDWLGAFRVSDFTRTVWRYTHVFTCYEKVGRKLLKGMNVNNDSDAVPGFYIFWPDGTYDKYGPMDVKSCSFGRHLEARGDARTYDIVHGGQAFYHKIVSDLRDRNVRSNVWDGFRLESETEIPD